MSASATQNPTPHTSRVKRFIKAALLLLALLILLLISTLYYLLGTSSGLQQLISTSQRWLPGELQVEQIDGSLLDNLKLSHVRYTQPNIVLSLESLALDWQPSALLSGRLHIMQLQVQQPTITLSGATNNEANADSPELPEITLPLSFQIDQLQISQLTLNQLTKEDAVATTEVSDIQLRLHSDAQTLILDHFSITAPQADLTLEGQLTPNGPFPIELNTQWNLKLPQQQTLAGQGSIKGTLRGNLNQLQIQQTLSGLVSTEITASLQNLLANPSGELSLQDFNAELTQLTPELTGRLTGSADASGNTEQLQLNSHWQTTLPEIGSTELTLKLHLAGRLLQIEQLDLLQTIPPTAPTNKTNITLAKPLAVALKGDVDLANTPISFDIKGQWQNLGYPFIGDADYLSPSGQLQVNGNLQQYTLRLNSTLADTSIPTGQWTLTGTGNQQSLNDIRLIGDTLDGQIQVDGSFAWQPLSWNFNLSGTQLNPASHWPEWPGKLRIKGSISGSQPPEQPLQLQLTLASLSGVLRNEPITAQGSLAINGSQISIPQLQLNLASTELKTQGRLDEQLDLNWSIKSPDLSQLLPTLKGDLHGSGSLTGTKALPHLIAKLNGQNLQYQRYQSGSLSADLDIDLGTDKNSHIQLTATKLQLEGQHWQQLSLKGQGSAAQHQLTLTTEQGPADIDLSLKGQWQEAQWRGQINQLDLTQSDLGPWHLSRPVPLQLSRSDASMTNLCLESGKENSSLCVGGQWSAENGMAGTLKTQQLSLNHLRAWMPNQIDLQGDFSADINFSQQPNHPPIFTGSARIKGAEAQLEEEDIQVIAGDIKLDLNGQNNQLNASLSLPLLQPVGQLTAQVAIDDLNTSQKLDAQLRLALSDLKFISLFAPQLQAITGQIDSDMSVTGRIDQPLMQGHLTLSDASTDLPALGIKLEGINLSLIGKPGDNNLQLTGALQSGKGPLNISGRYNPILDNGEITLQGERFQALATEDIQAWISPEIKLNIEPQLIRLSGELKIPEAHIQPPSIDTSSPLSEDVVIIDPASSQSSDGQGGNKKRVLETQLRITLGDKVYLDALGFKGRLLGSILVEDNARQVTRATGIMQVATGQYRLYGQDLDITRGNLVYSGGPIDNPGLDLRVSRTVDDVTAGAKVSGTLSDPRLTLFSDPVMPESNQLSYLIFGHALGASGSAMTEQELLFKAASALTLKGGNSIAEQISETFDIDDLGVAGDTTDTSFYIGKYLSPRLYVKYGVGLLESTHTFFMRYKLNESWSVETQTATEHNGGDLFYTLER
ncbi:hypothetical protein EH243_10300 [Amphritea opalescens]|uniref:Translocation and assembly module TamB C-terminal domain-containing protein n=1 Tax=Amphritea opalescens TaxID=2490544 RepID=A0A430KQ73_9GAMM|nr:translocation/assembly module TamB domain-containing protein [Amphritea opalescens]RTE65657.1 hypothetical protein EH243_10300 [Amphritea opalescens]